MGKIYFLYNSDNNPPAPYTKETGWNNRFLRMTNSVAAHGTIGGNDQHEHGYSDFGCEYGTWTQDDFYSHAPAAALSHYHNFGSMQGNTADNNPSFYTLCLISCDYNTWVNTLKCVPGNVILPFEASTDWSEVERFASPDNKLIKISGSIGSTGGSDTHGHELVIGLSTIDPSYVSGCYAGGSTWWRYMTGQGNHSHTWNKSITGANILPKRLKTRLYKTLGTTSKLLVGSIAFLDFTPTQYWDLRNWTETYLMSANQNAEITGSNTHDHGNPAGTSDMYDNEYCAYKAAAGFPYPATSNHHTHAVDINISSISHQPPYVNLIPFKLNTTLDSPQPPPGKVIISC